MLERVNVGSYRMVNLSALVGNFGRGIIANLSLLNHIHKWKKLL